MIKQITVRNFSVDPLESLVLTNPETSGFIILGIDGLGPVKANINMRDNAITSGSTFNSSRTPYRNIVLTLQFLPTAYEDSHNITIENTRLKSYDYFPVESMIRIDVTTDKALTTIVNSTSQDDEGEPFGDYYIFGYVESNTPTIFSKSEGCVVSILCPDPYFQRAGEPFTGTIEQVAKLFSFPYSYETANDVDTFTDQYAPAPWNPTTPRTWTEMGVRFYQSILLEVNYDGTVDVGPKLILTADGGPVNNPAIYFFSPNFPGVSETLSFQFTDANGSLPPLQDGDRLEIICEPGNKSVQRYVAQYDIFLNYIGAVTPDSSWPILHPGLNLFSYQADIGGANIRFSYEFMRKYVGV